MSKTYHFSAAVSNSNGADNLIHAHAVVDRILAAGIDITREYDTWVQCGFALASLGEAGRELFCSVSSLHPDYSVQECNRKFDNLLNKHDGRIGIGTFFDTASRYGVDISLPNELKRKPGRPPKKAAAGAVKEKDSTPPITRAEKMLREMADFRYNVIKCEPEVRRKGSTQWKILDDRTSASFFVNLKKANIHISSKDCQLLYISEGLTPDYNPFNHYLDALPAWDGVTDYIEQFFDHLQFRTPEERAFCMPYLKKWFVNMVALYTGHTNDNQLMPVLVGPQNGGKGYFCQRILPPQLRDYGKVVMPTEKIDKDMLISLSEKVLIIFDEFELFAKNSSTMKAIITIGDNSIRKPFAQRPTQLKRIASFIGTTNEDRYIAEEAGDRRYLTVNVRGTVRFTDTGNPLPYEGAYAQAWHMMQHCVRDYFHISTLQAQDITRHNKQHVKLDTCEEYISIYFRKPNDDEPGVMMGAAEICEYITRYSRQPAINPNNIGKAMKRMGFDGRNTRNVFKYNVVKLPIDEGERKVIAQDEGLAFYNETRANKTTKEVYSEGASTGATDGDPMVTVTTATYAAGGDGVGDALPVHDSPLLEFPPEREAPF